MNRLHRWLDYLTGKINVKFILTYNRRPEYEISYLCGNRDRALSADSVRNAKLIPHTFTCLTGQGKAGEQGQPKY